MQLLHSIFNSFFPAKVSCDDNHDSDFPHDQAYPNADLVPQSKTTRQPTRSSAARCLASTTFFPPSSAPQESKSSSKDSSVIWLFLSAKPSKSIIPGRYQIAVSRRREAAWCRWWAGDRPSLHIPWLLKLHRIWVLHMRCLDCLWLAKSTAKANSTAFW